jgi:dihydrofolate reductase
MAATAFFSVSMSLDGFIAPQSPEELIGRQWMELQQWIFPQRFLRENLKRGEGGEEGRDNDIVRETSERTGASVMGKRMFDAGDRDVRIAGGGATIVEYVNAGLIDEFTIALSPVLFGSGIRLFEGVDAGRVALEPVRAEPSARVTHLTYAVRER